MLVISALLADVMMVSSSLASATVLVSVVGTAMVVVPSCKVVAVDADGSDTVDGDDDDGNDDDEDGKVTISSWLSDSTGEEGT
jgi:hypothetical protein